MSIDLTEPPVVVNCGVATHGVQRTSDVYWLPQLWAVHLYGYNAELVIDGTVHRIGPGSVSLVPPRTVTEYRYRGPSTHHYAHLTAADTGSPETLVLSPGHDHSTLTEHFSSAVAHATLRPERTRAELWLALQRITAQRPEPTEATDHVARAIQWIETHLDEPLTVPQIAAAVGLSHTHLTRLVRTHTGRTVVAHLRHRRVSRAVHLLQNTSLSIGAIAAATGFSDLQTLNKACRQETGRSPRQLRAG
ncbi:MAG TPA: helix-turn-helix transcriptional regulator [Candidatus Avipropionibacterium avicola]|uniref:Helix-turn-helix transcriptional regulator n=1 Tax=Candidatus Avipropionibacterium avicola TaxID=2840701 RepID=A0A9D1KMI6_9ACTN|nr:helix-turn-helix transcriptional regulator [Candidatus Avipropionibacterium avicola]